MSVYPAIPIATEILLVSGWARQPAPVDAVVRRQPSVCQSLATERAEQQTW